MPPPSSRIPLEVQEKGKRRFFEDEDDLPPPPTLMFKYAFLDYIPLKDPISLPKTDFLPSTETLALLDRARRRDKPFVEAVPVMKVVVADNSVADKNGVDCVANSDGATKAVMIGGQLSSKPHVLCSVRLSLISDPTTMRTISKSFTSFLGLLCNVPT